MKGLYVEINHGDISLKQVPSETFLLEENLLS